MAGGGFEIAGNGRESSYLPCVDAHVILGELLRSRDILCPLPPLYAGRGVPCMMKGGFAIANRSRLFSSAEMVTKPVVAGTIGETC